MRTRLDFRSALQAVSGMERLYFQPPESVRMTYPCIRYELEDLPARRADNSAYTIHLQYSVTVIDKDPDSVYPERILNMPMCMFDRFYTADNLNHWVFRISY